MSTPRNDNATGQGREGVKADTNQFELCFSSGSLVKPLVYPSARFLPGRVLAILLTGRRFTHLDAWRELGHSRLSDSIWKLRRLGWPVEMIEKTVATSDAGRPAAIGIYYLTTETIAEVGERGQQYAAECARIEAERRTT